MGWSHNGVNNPTGVVGSPAVGEVSQHPAGHWFKSQELNKARICMSSAVMLVKLMLTNSSFLVRIKFGITGSVIMELG